jgi:uncharacterized protein YukJ
MSHLTYSLLKGRALDAKPFGSNPHQRPHYHLLIEGGGARFDVAVNIASEDPHVQDVRVLYAVKPNIQPANADSLKALEEGVRNLPAGSPLRLDYVADGLVSQGEMSLLPLYDPAATRPASDEIADLVNRAVNYPQAQVYAFGHRYTHPLPQNDAWGFSPDDGVHNIHMNQGNAPGNHDNENGRHEDGALWIYFGDTDTWAAVYVAFQTQSWDNKPNGYPKHNPGP